KDDPICFVTLAMDQEFTTGPWVTYLNRFRLSIQSFPISLTEDIFPLTGGTYTYQKFLTGYGPGVELLVVPTMNLTHHGQSFFTMVQDHLRRGLDVLLIGDEQFSSLWLYLVNLGRQPRFDVS